MITRSFLVGTLLVTGIALADILRRDELDARTAAAYLLLFSVLFLLRVGSQVLVWRRAPGWLPPMGQWNLLPYRFLLPIQVTMLVLMGLLVSELFRDGGPVAERSSGLGTFLIGLSGVYAAAMAVRYAVRMRRRPGERWFGGAIPIVFHLVLAAFLLTWGRYHVSG